MKLKAIAKSATPPILWRAMHRARRLVMGTENQLTFAPAGWETPIVDSPGRERTWASFLDAELAEFHENRQRMTGTVPLMGISSDMLSGAEIPDGRYVAYLTYAYALAIAAAERPSLKILDYGGNLGEHYWVAKWLLPGVNIEYHCKELPLFAAAGAKVSPEIQWHTDDSCFDDQYDLVFFSASLPYLRDWREVLKKASRAARRYLFLTRVPSVARTPGYVAVQRYRDVEMLHQLLNYAELIAAVSSPTLRLEREFILPERHEIEGAPEQPVYRALLFSVTSTGRAE